KARVRYEWRRRRYLLDGTEHLSRTLVDSDSPQVEAPASVTREVQILTVRGPHRVPVEVRIARHNYGRTTRCEHRLDLAPSILLGPVRDPVTVWRPGRL